MDGMGNKINKKVLILSLADVLVLSLGHALNAKGIILIGLTGFAGLILLSPKPTFLPIMLFYLPWSPVMKFSPESFSFYTIIVPVFFIIMLLSKKDNKAKSILELSSILIACLLIILTMTVKLFLAYGISMNYLMFMMMLVFMPAYLKVCKGKLSFEWCIVFFSLGIIAAGISSEILMNYPHMLNYIDVSEWASVGLTRLSGFYGDANFYSAHILVAICGLLIVAVNKHGKNAVFGVAMVIVLIYFGFLSVSKMFLLVLLSILVIWIIAVMSMRGKTGTKAYMAFFIGLGVLFILSSGIFSKEIDMYLTRFGMVDNVDSLTTGRSDLLTKYISFFGKNPVGFLFGQGYTNVFSGDAYKGSHNSIMQMIYQFGCTGTLIIAVWISQLSKAAGKVKGNSTGVSGICLVIALAFACFVPWMSLDILFFDEFFYITALFFIGKNYIVQEAGTDQKYEGEVNAPG